MVCAYAANHEGGECWSFEYRETASSNHDVKPARHFMQDTDAHASPEMAGSADC